MKKYKHIKTGDIVSKIDNDIIRFYTSNKFGIIHAEIVENSNDWLEITKPEYTILSYKCKNKILYYTITEDNHRWFSSNKNDMYQTNEMEIEVNSHLGFTIHSVKRLSDGEIFTVGDITCIGKIKSFELGAEQNLGIIIVHGEFSQQLSHITKVKLKEWEITAFKCSKNNILYTLKTHDERDHHFILNGLRHREREILEHFKSLEIYSVKRLSDGEEFKIGNKCEQGIIKSFEILNNIFQVNFIEKNNCPIYFKYLRKAKQPLFTTEDGVDIYVGDNYFELIIPGFHNAQCVWNILPYEGRCNLIYDQEGNRKHFRLWFSTKEKAEEYILMNKPCLSYNDLKYCIEKSNRNKTLLKTVLLNKIKEKCKI